MCYLLDLDNFVQILPQPVLSYPCLPSPPPLTPAWSGTVTDSDVGPLTKTKTKRCDHQALPGFGVTPSGTERDVSVPPR